MQSNQKQDRQPNANNSESEGWDATTTINIHWHPKDVKSMLKAQVEINDLLLSNDFHTLNNIKDTIHKLKNDIENYYTSTCDVCGNKQSTFTHMNVEHISMETDWGYESNHDCETHSLTLCCDCYDKHIMKGFLGKYVKVTHYM